jgi:hypothetical protein
MAITTKRRGFRWWNWWIRGSSHMLMFGLLVACVSCQLLLESRLNLLPVLGHRVLDLATVFLFLWWCWAFFPGWRKPQHATRLIGFRLILIIAILILIWQRQSAWSVVCIGPVLAAFLPCWYWGAGWPAPIIAITGSCSASIAVFLAAWPNNQRFLIVWIAFGLFTSLQGAIILVRCIRKLSDMPETVSVANA